MAVICLNCEGWGCLQCQNDRDAAAGGEQGPHPLELEVQRLKQRALYAEGELELALLLARAARRERDALAAELALRGTLGAV